MSGILLPDQRIYTGQPPPGRGLDKQFFAHSVYAYNFNGDTPRNMAQKSYGKPLTKGTAVFKGVDNGVGLFSTADASTRAYGDSSVTNPIVSSDGAGTGDFCLAFAIKPISASTRRVLFHHYGGTQTYIVINGYLDNGSGSFTNQSGTLWVGSYEGTAVGGRGVKAVGVVTGAPLCGVFNRRGNIHELWIGGLLISSYDSGGNNVDVYDGGAYQLGINGRADQTGYSSNVSAVMGIYAANRRLGTKDSDRVSRNHWALYEPRKEYFFVDLSSGTTLNAVATGGAKASGAGSIAPQVALAGVGVAHAGGNGTAMVRVPLAAAGLVVSGGEASATATVTISAEGLAQAAGQAGLSAVLLSQAAGAAKAAGNASLMATLFALAHAAARSSGGALPGATVVLHADGGAHSGGSAELASSSDGSLLAAGKSTAGGAAVLSVSVRLAATGGAGAGGQGTAQAVVQASAHGAATATGSGHGDVTQGLQAHGAGKSTASGFGAWSVLVTLTAEGFVRAMGEGAFSVDVPLSASGAAAARGSATARLSEQTKVFRMDDVVERLTFARPALSRRTHAHADVRRVTHLFHGVSHV